MSWKEIPGWFAFQSAYDEAIARAPSEGAVFVEVGVAFGRSLAYLATKAHESGKKIKIYAVDPWWDDWWMMPSQYPETLARPSWGGEYSQFGRDLGGPFSAFLHCMRTYAPDALERVNVLRCTSAQASKMIGACDLVMIDGNHDYDFVVHDIALWRPHMKAGGILAGDDFHISDFPGVCQAVREAFGAEFEIHGTTWVKRC